VVKNAVNLWPLIFVVYLYILPINYSS
jgi:hypothetical protein